MPKLSDLSPATVAQHGNMSQNKANKLVGKAKGIGQPRGNALDRFMAAKTGAPHYLDGVGRMDPQTGVIYTEDIPRPWRQASEYAVPEKLSLGQATNIQQQRMAIDPLDLRQARLRGPAVTHSAVMNMPSGFAEWARKIGPRGLMALFSPAGIVEGAVMDRTGAMDELNMLAGQQPNMQDLYNNDPEAYARYGGT